MKPRKLKIKGLNSFKEEQIIDFERLTEKGFFGIFGPTGCGKSSILDAVTYALYGKIIRDNTGFINVSEDTVEISYEFEIGIGTERKVFIIDRTAKRDVKKGGYKSTLTRLVEKDEENLIILADKKSEVDNYITEIIGLTMEDFTRAVVLPQGKFGEFLKTSPSDRRDMLERIFALQKYGRGLGDKIKAVSRENKEKLSVLSGKLSQYEGISEETLVLLKEELKLLIEEEKVLSKEKLLLDEQFEKYKILWGLQQELKFYEEKLALLLNKQHEIIIEKHKAERGRAALQVKPFIDNLIDNDKKLIDNENELKKISEILKKLRERFIITEKKHEEALKIKDRDIPLLVAKEENLKQAIELEVLKKKREEERAVLADQYRKVAANKKVLENTLKEIAILREDKNLKLLEIEKSINSSRIEPEYREKLNKAFMEEKEYKKALKFKADLEEKIKKTQKTLNEERAVYDQHIKKQNEKNEALERHEVLLKDLYKNCPGDNTALLESHEFINRLKKYCSDFKENKIKYEEHAARLRPIEKQLIEIGNSLEVHNQEQLCLEKNLDTINTEIDRIKNNNLASILAAKLMEGDNCPVCGSSNFVKLAKPINIEDLNNLENNKHELEVSRENIKKAAQSLELKKVELDIELKHIKVELLAVKEKNEEVKTVIQKLNVEFVDERDLEIKVETLEKKFLQLKNDIDKWNRDIQKAEELLKLLREEKSIVDAEALGLREGIKKDLKNNEVLQNEFVKAENEFKEIARSYEKLKEDLALDNIEERYNGLIELDKTMKSLEREEKEIREFIIKLDKGKTEKEEEKYELSQEEAKISQSGVEKKIAIEDYIKQINKLSQGEIPSVHIVQVQKEIKAINDEEAHLKKELEEEKQEMQKMEQSKAASEKSMETLSKLKEELKFKLNKSLTENSFKDIEEARGYFIEASLLDEMEKGVKGYEEQLGNVNNSIANIKNKLDGEGIEEEEWIKLQEDRELKRVLLNEKLESKVKKNKEMSDMELSLSKIKELAKEQKELEHKESLLKELEKLVQGNKLVEFVATSQLKYVSAEASKRLKDITRGRYALELDDNGSFVMRDDFNGGLRRSTNSLSGGEIFLTSLSLALALSSQIQLKGRTPLEFFFLDEGFGTLDSELLDTVMSSLESLRSDRLCVGIISHVEEIKNRVPIKLIVLPAELGEGTKVRIEKS